MTVTARFAQVAVLAQLGRAGGLFTYRLPENLAALVTSGSLVRVPFTNRRFQGVVCSLEMECQLPRVRDVEEILDPVPVVTPHQLSLAQWITEYYGAPISDVIGAMLPPGLGRKTIYFLQLGGEPAGHRISPTQSQILSVIGEAVRIGSDEIQRQLPHVDVEKDVTSMLRRGLVVRSAELAPPRASARMVRIVSVTPSGEAALQGGAALKRAPQRRAVLEAVARSGPISLQDLTHQIARARETVKVLHAQGFVCITETPARRTPDWEGKFEVTRSLDFSPAQRSAYELITQSLDTGASEIFLLHGVTGSGKTEVYLQAIEKVITSGRQAIMMVPEISLTPQAVERVAGRFPGRVAVLHSKLSDGERLDEWQRIRHGDAQVVVGPRSALFAPVPHPGLLVVDEEHDPSYKQDSSPRYNARDAAAVLGRLTGATVLFGSATPDVVTYHAARSGRIKLLELPTRPVWGGGTHARAMPPVEVVDMRHELEIGNHSIFSTQLLEALHRTLSEGHQALLFLNRRGSATVVLCRDCGYVVQCPNCDIPFTYHSAGVRLICHRCDKRAVSPRSCPRCKGPHIRFLGIGTQRVEEEVAKLFPQARVLRWDRDVTGGKGAHEQIVHRFARHEADILVGTQMIAKGLDFPLVTLVGVISADTGLHLPDFRAPERSFQLLTQVAGRAGRASLPSRVVVQTYTPEHYAIVAAQDHDYHRFYDEELGFRRAAGYPPFARLIRFIYSSEVDEQCRRAAANLRSILSSAIEEEALHGAELIGPAPRFASKVKNRYYWQILARSGKGGHRKGLHPLLDHVPPGWTVDVDPVDLL